MPEYRLRPATSADLPFLQGAILALESHERHGIEANALRLRADFPEQIERWLTSLLDAPHALVIVAESEDETRVGCVLGFIQQQPNPFTDYQQHGVIQAVWVEEAFRRQGIADGLVTAMESCFGELGIPYVEIQHTVGNAEASAFWQRRGYAQDTMTRRRFLQPTAD